MRRRCSGDGCDKDHKEERGWKEEVVDFRSREKEKTPDKMGCEWNVGRKETKERTFFLIV